MIAFMKYDLFPYVVSGKVLSIKDGKVLVANYGTYDEKSLKAIYPDDVGEKIIKDIKAITEKYNYDSKILHQNAIDKINISFKG